ncbi:MAG: phosphoesterase [Winogradskyella sp.]|uniref:phosphoesterase n=1 Tax=Winogradskyella sp. TaxID=1883156 RepID=UPI001819B765|nr:phosphoesterase [Winogradskyella sp.]
MKSFLKIIFLLSIAVFFSACATLKEQSKNNKQDQLLSDKVLNHSFYLIGDAGNFSPKDSLKVLNAFRKELNNASKNSTAIFLGDNVFDEGLPKKSSPNYQLAKYRLNEQLEATNDFKGDVIFLPGHRDWKLGVSRLKNQEKFIEDALGKNTFLPENGCPIENIHISEDIELIIVDSQWYINDWNKHPTINDDCDIKTRQEFLDEFNGLIKKSRGKTTIVAMHHPMYTNGPYGGQYSFGSHMLPLPVVGTFKNVFRRTSGLLETDLQSPLYKELKRLLVTLSQANKKVVFVSGHENSLQYIEEDNLRQIVSGTGSKVTPVRAVGDSKFAYGTKGFAKLDVYTDGSSFVTFYSVPDNSEIFKTQVFNEDITPEAINYGSDLPQFTSASIYTEDETAVNGFYKWLWGERYRDVYSTNIKVRNVLLDTLYGGLTPVRKGGGNQSKSLRLEDKNGTQYVMRALRKQALQYLQAVLFRDQYIEGQFDDTATEALILDVFTGAHPYAPFVVGDLADAIGVYHTNPVLFYIPKQKNLGSYNDEFGDELYMIEEHTSEGHSDKANFGYQDKLISTIDMMRKIHNDEDIIVDEAAYIKARLFDMLIGDWDRHQDQWRWIEFKENGQKIYRPMPRDRDQAFSKMSDGVLLGSAVNLVPTARLLRKYSDDLVDVEGINIEPYPLDMELIMQSRKDVWDDQVKLIQNNITDAVIEKAFLNVPDEVRGMGIDEIKSMLKARRSNLQKISDRYFKLINKYAVIKGTNKDDWFDIKRMPNGQTKVTAYRIKDGEKMDIFHERTYNVEQTKEIWVYGLDDDDIFDVAGSGDNYIKLRLVGGQNHDKYNIQNGKRITFYDYKSKQSTIVTNKGNKKFTDDYETNVYDYKKLKNNTTEFLPAIGANPDDGFKVGANLILTSYGFERNPIFTNQHHFSAGYYFATNGFEIGYSGEFSNLFPNINFGIDVQFNSPNYAVNFFGFGNETPNPEADENDGLDVDLDYNRVKIRSIKVMPKLIWRGQEGASFIMGVSYESNEVERTQGRFISTLPPSNPVFTKQDFYGVDAHYQFTNKDNEAFPTLGFQTALQFGYKNNVDTSNGFGYIIPELGFDYKLVQSGQLVLATVFRGHFNLGNNFEFYQGANLGADSGLRGYRFQRFTGKNAFSQSTDVRWNFGSLKTGLLPIHIGVYGGVDYGRVWLENDNSDRWNNSFGGGLFVTMAEMMTANISAFNSDDGLRLAFKLGFGF